jgi:signal transduction histidine kinase
VAYTSAPIWADGAVVGVVVAFQDITARQRQAALQRQLTARLNILVEVGRAILAAQTPTQIAEAAAQRLPELLPCQAVRIVLFDPVAGAAAPILAMRDTTPPLLPPPPPDLRAAPAPPQGRFSALLGGSGCPAYLRIPLRVAGVAMGLLEIGARAGGFGPAEVTIAQEVADQLALALHQAHLFDQVAAGRRHLQQLAQQLVETQEAERRHLARELHDDLGQALTALKLGAQAARNLTDSTQWAQAQGEQVALIDELLASVRRLAHDLRPPLLEELGLAAALESQITRQALRAGLHPTFQAAGDFAGVPAGLATTCFRVAQEALTNVVRHAHAQRVGLALTAGPTTLDLRIWDDGVGFVVAGGALRPTADGSLGLVGIQERTLLAGGTVTIQSAPAAGTTVWAQFPLSPVMTATREGGAV